MSTKRLLKQVKNYQPRDKYADVGVEDFDVRVKGDVKIVLYDWDKFGSADKMCHFWFNTGLISNNYLLLHKVCVHHRINCFPYGFLKFFLFGMGSGCN